MVGLLSDVSVELKSTVKEVAGPNETSSKIIEQMVTAL